jgi:hypothetical protein
MRKLVAITTALSVLGFIPVASAQTTNPPAATTQPKATPAPRANTTTMPKARAATDATVKPDRMTRRTGGKMRYARHNRRMHGVYGYRAMGRHHHRHSWSGSRYHRAYGYRASTRCR